MLYLFSSRPETIESYLRQKNISYELVDKQKYGIFLQTYIPKPDDWGIVYDFGKIVPESLLQNLLLLNIHFSLLPKFRGAIPVEAAILAGETKTGITIQKMAKGMDSGDILFMHQVDINENWTSGELQSRMDSLLPVLFDKLLSLPREKWKFTPQEGTPTFCYIKELNRDQALINFDQITAEEVVRRIRGYNPEPLAWTRIVRNGKQLEMNLYKGTCISEICLQPKELQFIKQQGVAIGTHEGTVLVQELLISGSKALKAGDIVALKGSIQLV